MQLKEILPKPGIIRVCLYSSGCWVHIFHLYKCADNGNLMILHVKSVKFNGMAKTSPLCQAELLKNEKKGLGKSNK